MSVTFNFEVEENGLAVKAIDGKQNVIVGVKWVYIADDGSGNQVQRIGQSNLDLPTNNFTPFEFVTLDQVRAWVDAIENLSALNESFEQRLLELAAIPVRNPSEAPQIVNAPWMPSPTSQKTQAVTEPSNVIG